MLEVTAAPRRPGTFPPGTSGNPGGRPKGARDRPWEGLDGLLRRAAKREAPAIVNALVAAAKGGDVQAAAALLAAFQRAGEAPNRFRAGGSDFTAVQRAGAPPP